MAKPRKQTYTLQMYLQKVKELDIRSDQDVQRLSGAWNNNMLNELIATVLNDGYIPPIILGEEANSQMWIRWVTEKHGPYDVPLWELPDHFEHRRACHFLPCKSEGCGRGSMYRWEWRYRMGG